MGGRGQGLLRDEDREWALEKAVRRDGQRGKVCEGLAERWAGGQESGPCQRRMEEQKGGNYT